MLIWLTKLIQSENFLKAVYYSCLFLYIVYLITGVILIITNYSSCGMFSTFWVFSVIQFTITNLSPVIGTAAVLSYRDLHYNRSSYEQNPAAFKTFTLIDQILHTFKYFEFTEDDAGQILLTRSLSITLVIQLCVIIYSAVMLFGNYVCSSMYDSGLYIFCMFTYVFLLSLLISSIVSVFILEGHEKMDVDSSSGNL